MSDKFKMPHLALLQKKSSGPRGIEQAPMTNKEGRLFVPKSAWPLDEKGDWDQHEGRHDGQNLRSPSSTHRPLRLDHRTKTSPPSCMEALKWPAT